MNLGSLDRTVTFQRATFTTNGRNEKIPAGWEPVATVRARRDPVSDGERNNGAQVERLVTDRFTTHYSRDLAALDLTQQLVCDGVAYDLVGRKELGRREGLEWSAKAKPGVAP